jgi:membrane-associated phospholipid phosphatase
MTRLWMLTLFALAAAAAATGVYAMALGTGRGLHWDEVAMLRGWDGAAFPQVHEAIDRLVRSIDVASLALAAAGLAALALLRGRPWHSLAAFVMIGGPILTTEYLKPHLGSADPFGGEPFRAVHATFPSGHATIAMSIALTLVFVTPAASRLAAAAIGAGYAGTVGVGLVALGAHYPSDVLGGFLVAACWAGLVAAAVLALQDDHAEAEEPPASGELIEQARPIAVALGLIALSVAAYLLASRAGELRFYGAVHTSFFAAAATILVAAIALCAYLTAALGGFRLGRRA